MTTQNTNLETCGRCYGSGKFYGAGSVVNGVFQGYVGECFRCKGTGRCTPYQNELGSRGIVERATRDMFRDTEPFTPAHCEKCGRANVIARFCGDCSEDMVADIEAAAAAETRELIDELLRERPILLPLGTYTMGLADGTHFTFRVRDVMSGRLAGKRIVEYLFGPNNSLDFRAFATVNANSINVWRRFEGGKLVQRAREIEVLARGDAAGIEAAGLLYAVKSQRCRRCNRVLTVEESVTTGYGAVCAAIVGVAYGDVDPRITHAKAA